MIMFLGIKVVLTNLHGMKEVVEVKGEVVGVVEVLTATDLAAVEVLVVQTVEVLVAQIAEVLTATALAVGTEVSVVLIVEVLAAQTVAAVVLETAVVEEALAADQTVVVVEVLVVQTAVVEVALLDPLTENGLMNLPHLTVKIPASGHVKNLAIVTKRSQERNASAEVDGENGLMKPQ